MHDTLIWITKACDADHCDNQLRKEFTLVEAIVCHEMVETIICLAAKRNPDGVGADQVSQ